MKSKFLSLALVALLAIILISCSTSEPNNMPVLLSPTSNTPVVGVNTGDLKLFVIDTAKVKTVSMTGTNENTILNRKQNSNSYLNDISINTLGTSFVYSDLQTIFIGGVIGRTNTIRKATIDGTGDITLFTTGLSLGSVKYGIDKIYFTTINETAFPFVMKLNSINLDGSNAVVQNFYGDATSAYNADFTTDGRFTAINTSVPNIPRLTIIDKTLDSGSGVYFSETLPSGTCSFPTFSYDDKFAYMAFVENASLKIRIVNMSTKTAETKTIAPSFSPSGSYNLHLSVGSDNNRGVVVVRFFGNTPSKSYVFNLNSGSSTNFNNNDENIFRIQAF